jgi:hypothetical protein
LNDLSGATSRRGNHIAMMKTQCCMFIQHSSQIN